MTPEAKIRFVKNRIEDKITISPKGPIVLPVTDIFTKSFTLLAKEQYLILKKLQEDGFIKGLIPLEAEYHRLELQKYLTAEARNAAFQHLILEWGAYRDSNPN